MAHDCQQSPSRPAGRSILLALLVGAMAWVGSAAAEDDPPPPPAPPLERLFAPVKEAMQGLPPFLRDTDLKIHFRTYYFNREKPRRRGKRGPGVRRLARLPVRLALRHVRHRRDLLRLGAALRAGRQGRHELLKTGRKATTSSARPTRPSGTRTTSSPRAIGRRSRRATSTAEDNRMTPEYLRGPDGRREGGGRSTTSVGTSGR